MSLIITTDIGKELKRIRRSKGLFIKEVALLMGVTTETVKQIEHGTNNSNKTIKLYAEALGAEIFYGIATDNVILARLIEFEHKDS